MRAILLSAALATVALAKTGSVNFRGVGKINRAQIKSVFAEEMSFTDEDLASYEDGLRPMFKSLPKNAHGNLGHQAVRKALHRFFVHRHNWWLRGLYLSPTTDESAKIEEKDRVPDLLQDTFESFNKHNMELGADLFDLAALAASVEQLVSKETQVHLNDCFRATEVAPDHVLTRESAHNVIHTYFMSFLLEHNWTVESGEDLRQKNSIFAARYPLYGNASNWLLKLFDEEVGVAETIDYNTTLKVANAVGEEYHVLNDQECTDLTAALQQMESRKPGRVRLSVFYNMSLHSHWKFNEKVDTLRNLGALDESDPSAKYVIIPNYAMARPNCVNASNIYEICCPNTCERIMGFLERDIGNSSASVQRISGLIAKLNAASKPQELPMALLNRLQQVADHHGGHVPLHGRLFAQWLHHAYPLECPYPHESGTTNPASWTGQESDQATEVEIMQHVEADSCYINEQGKIDCGEESSDLPWNTAEELLITGSKDDELHEVGNQCLIVVAMALAGAAGLALYALRKGRKADTSRLVMSLLVTLGLAGLAAWLDLFDPVIVVVGALVGVLANFSTRSWKGSFTKTGKLECM